jgi:DNA (cytosine-5)-methyltransferase 3A
LVGKTNCLTSVAKDNLILQINPSKESGGNQPYQQNRIYDINGQMPALNAELGGRNNITDGYNLRRLTPTECARLQTIPEWYEWIVSDTQIYRMLGNGWTVEVIKHIFYFMDQFHLSL